MPDKHQPEEGKRKVVENLTHTATQEMRSRRSRALNDNYASLLEHYGLRSTRINRNQSHENGDAKQGHHRLKDTVDQALILRGSRDFDTGWIKAVD